MDLKDLFLELDRLVQTNIQGKPLPLDGIKAALLNFDISTLDVEKLARFDERYYQRVSLRFRPAYEVLLLCWRYGQQSPIHDHYGSNCGVKIIEGEMTEEVFRLADGLVVPAGVPTTGTAGRIICSSDRDIHQISNHSWKGADLLTLHIYSPPLRNMNAYFLSHLAEWEAFDPVI